MNTFRLTALAALVLGLVCFFGSPLLISTTISYVDRRFTAFSTFDELAPRISFALLMALCAVVAGVTYTAYSRWYAKSSLPVFLGMLAATMMVASLSIGLNLWLLQEILKHELLPERGSLSMRSLAYFDWGIWPVVGLALIAIAILFLFQPADQEDETGNSPDYAIPTENVDRSS